MEIIIFLLLIVIMYVFILLHMLNYELELANETIKYLMEDEDKLNEY